MSLWTSPADSEGERLSEAAAMIGALYMELSSEGRASAARKIMRRLNRQRAAMQHNANFDTWPGFNPNKIP
jgi:hypothetical protein